MFYVYVLRNLKQNLYVGYSTDLKARLKAHNGGQVYTTSRLTGPWELVYYEAGRAKADALQRERYLKSGPGRAFLCKRLRYDCGIK